MAGKSAAEKAAEAAAGAAVKVDGVGDGAARIEAIGTSGAAVAVTEALAAGAPGGPGVGAARAAEVVEGTAVREMRLPDAGGPLHHHPAEGVATFPRPADPRPAEGLRFERAVVTGPEAAVVRRTGRDEILPLSAPMVDPASVPGRKVATAAAPQVRRDKRTYVRGETFPVDFRAFTELAPIGAIEATPWHELPDHEG